MSRPGTAPPLRARAPGSLLHLDAKRLGKIGVLGHRIHGDRTRRARGVGWEVAFVAVEDHTRLAYAEVLPEENARYATAMVDSAATKKAEEATP